MIVSVTVSDEMVSESRQVKVDALIYRRVSSALDHPAPHADAIQRMFCSDPATIKAAMQDRVKLSKEISELITKQLMDIFSSKDTVMGYKVIHKNNKENNP